MLFVVLQTYYRLDIDTIRQQPEKDDNHAITQDYI